MAAVSLSVSTVKPLGDRVFVKVSESEEKTAGGILLPDTAKEKPQVGEVAQVGPGKRNDDGSRQAPEIGNQAPGHGGRASTKPRYLRKSDWPGVVWASMKLWYLRGLVWASQFPSWASRCPCWASQSPSWALRLRRWASGLAVFPQDENRFLKAFQKPFKKFA